jgi:hypothetical protein
MHPSRNGHEFIADSFAHLLRNRGFDVGTVELSAINNRSKRDSILWMLRNGTPWFLKRSVDLLPAMIALMASEAIRNIFTRSEDDVAQIIYPDFEVKESNSALLRGNERVS